MRGHKGCSAAAVVAILAAVAGCSSTSGQKPGSVGATPSAMASSAAPQLTVGATVPASELGARMTRAIMAQGTVHELITTSEGTVDAFFDLSASPPKARVVGSGGPLIGDIRVVDGDVYVKTNDIAPRLSGNKTWLKVPSDAKKPENSVVVLAYSFLAELSVVGPMLATLGDAPVTVVNSTPEATRYEMTVSREQYGRTLKALGADPELIDAAVPKMRNFPAKTTFSVDDRDLPVLASGLSDPARGYTEGTFNRWGEPVVIERPPASLTQSAE